MSSSTVSASSHAAAPPQPSLAAAGHGEGEEAGSAAVQRAVSGLDGSRPSLVLLFPDGALDAEGQVTQAVANAAGAPVAGMTGSGAFGAAGPMEKGCSALAFGPGIYTAVGVVDNASRGLRGAASDAAKAALRDLGDSGGAHILMALFLDTPSGAHAEALAGAYEAAGPSVPLVGGGAGGKSTWQFAEGRARYDSVVAVALRSSEPIGVGHAHGAVPCASPSVVTRAGERTVLQLDGRPADEVYLEKLGHAGATLDAEEFHQLAAVHPLAQPELSGDVRLRQVLGPAREGGLICATHIPVNAAVEFTQQSPEAIVRSTWTAVSDALAPLDGKPARAALVFDSAGRRSALGGPGEQLDAEAAALRSSFGPTPPPLAGLYTRGEVGRVRGAKGDRNHAVVVAAFA